MSVEDELRHVEERWAAAIEGGDLDACDAILGDDFVLSSTGGVGSWISRDEWFVALGQIETRAFGISGVQSRVFGDTAVVRMLARWEATLTERDLTGDYLVVDVFTRDAGTWQASWRISQRLSES